MSIESKVSRLSLDIKNARSPKKTGELSAKAVEETPESWEDEITSPVEAPGPSLKQITSNDGPAPPPPTPVSPHADPMSQRWESGSLVDSGKPTPRYSTSTRENGDRRPEKTTATANRMIAGALGIRAPKKTEEQKQYDKAAKEAEIKRRNREKEQQEQKRLEEEKAKAAIWDA